MALRIIQKKILELLVQAGARMATAGEFTMRAFLNGKLDLNPGESCCRSCCRGFPGITPGCHESDAGRIYR